MSKLVNCMDPAEYFVNGMNSIVALKPLDTLLIKTVLILNVWVSCCNYCHTTSIEQHGAATITVKEWPTTVAPFANLLFQSWIGVARSFLYCTSYLALLIRICLLWATDSFFLKMLPLIISRGTLFNFFSLGQVVCG